MTDADDGLSRRTLLAGGGALAGLAGAGLIGATVLDGDESGSAPTPTGTPVDEATARRLAERFAPDLHFGRLEKWFPTDPRPYVRERDGERVVDGFAALNGYSGEYLETGEPPAPTVFYNAVELTPDLVAVQYWMYYAFDQFTVNFHWHDWELLQVFVDVSDGTSPGTATGSETGEPTPVLLSASSHSRKVPNNEYLDPGDGDTVAVLSEVGSHSSATTVNEETTTFQRTALSDLSADVTNAVVSVADAVEALPLAYGLPRDEGGRLPFVMPELDGQPLYEHPDVTAGREAFVDEAVTVRSLSDLTTPPDLPVREHASTFTFEREGDATSDGATPYALAPVADLTDIDGFAGPQLSFEFAIPGFVEDQFAGHITTVGTPWEQPRFADPLADVDDDAHKRALAERYGLDVELGVGARLVGAVEELTGGSDGRLAGADGSDDAVRDRATVSLTGTTGEAVCLVESEKPAAVPTAGGVVRFQGIEERDHRLTVNAAGYAPRSERFRVSGDTAAGVDGRLPVVRRDAATKVRLGTDGTSVARLRATDDFAGPVFDAQPPTDGDAALYLHREGRYSLEVEDADGNLGAYRVEPEGDEAVTVEAVETGLASLADYLVDYLAASARLARDFERDTEDGDEEDGGRESAASKFEAARREAERAADAADQGDEERAREALASVVDRLERLREFLSRDDAQLSEGVIDLLGSRVETAVATAERARQGETATGTPMPTETA